jgi:putative ABC transport system permease protein
VPDEREFGGRPSTPRWRRYLRFWRSDVAADVDDELRFHIEERVDDLVTLGMHPDTARAEALRRLGDVARVRDTCRTLAAEQEKSMRRSEWFGALKQDLAYAVRSMRIHPSFSAAIVLTIALGIGGTTALFSVVNAVLLRPLPYADAERIVVLRESILGGLGNVAVGAFHDWSEQSTSFEATTIAQGRTYNLTDGEPARYSGASVAPGYFQVMRTRPALGRYFSPEETSASHVVILSFGLWQSRFSGDSTIIGRQIHLNGEKHTIIGVTPAEHTLTPSAEQLWTVRSFTPQQRASYGSHTSRAFAKLKPGVTLERAQGELDRIATGIRERHPEQMTGRGVKAIDYREFRVGNYDTQLWVLLGAVTVVLLIACVNVASLLLAHASTRSKEMAIRGALGSGRGRLVRQLMTESLVVAVAGGVLGLLIAKLGVRFLVAAGPSEVPRLGEARLNIAVLAFAAITTLTCGILFGLGPALRATRVDLQSVLRDGGRASRGAMRYRMRATLIVGEIAVTLVLLVGASLFLRSAHRLQHVDIGFEPSGVTMMRVALPADRYDSAATIHRAFSSILDAVRGVPGVETAGAGTRVPMSGTSFDFGVLVQSRPEQGERFPSLRIVTPGYFEAIGISIRRGRTFQASDLVDGAPPVVVVNETFAKLAFGNDNPIGQRISGWTAGSDPEWREVVGVIGDVRASGQDRDIPPEVYAPHTQARLSWWNSHQRTMTIVVKSKPGVTIAPGLREAVRHFDSRLPVFDFQPLERVLSESTATRRFNTTLLSLLGGTGLILAAIGIYGVIAFFVSQRAHEIGVRVALGASTRDVVVMVIREAILLASAGIVVGSAAAVWATRFLGSMLFEINERDPIAFAAGAAVLLLVALGASLLPARRAAHVDPMRALAAG